MFVLTNSRTMPELDAVGLSALVTARATAIGSDVGFELAVASRSDSTLRGHFPQVPDAVAGALEAAPALTVCSSPRLLGGRALHRRGVQWGRRAATRPHRRTEFACDGSFGYAASDLRHCPGEERGAVAPPTCTASG